MVKFTTRNGEVLSGVVIRQYSAFEGGMRYIISVNGKNYRCIKDNNGNFIEYVA